MIGANLKSDLLIAPRHNRIAQPGCQYPHFEEASHDSLGSRSVAYHERRDWVRPFDRFQTKVLEPLFETLRHRTKVRKKRSAARAFKYVDCHDGRRRLTGRYWI